MNRVIFGIKIRLRRLFIAVFLVAGISLLQASNTSNSNNIRQTVPVKLRCEYLVNPLGIENINPNLSWQINTSTNNWLQSAYQVIVATSPDLLSENSCDVWNSGKNSGSESVCIPCNGLKVNSRKRYYWKVRVWDTDGTPSAWSEPAYWEMGILNSSEWHANWISSMDNVSELDRKDIKWIWLSDQDATKVPRNTVSIFRINLNFEELPMVASLNTVVRGKYQLFVNGEFVDKKEKAWQIFERQDILQYLKIGDNNIEVKVEVVRTASFEQDTGKKLSGRYGVFAGLLKIEEKDGSIKKYPTSCGQWMSRKQNDEDWKVSKVVGELNDQRFGLDPGPLSQSASLFRNEFKVKKAVESARIYVSALGSYRMFVNGKRVGKDIFTPGFTNYNSRVLYQTYDITSLLKRGKNAVGCILGDGWYGSPLGWNGEFDVFGPHPNTLLAELYLLYKDGTTETIVTDESWKSDRSPILKSEIYSGEYYDARLEQEGWSTSGFKAKTWKGVKVIDGNYDILSSQVNTPVRITQEVKPVHIRKADNQRWIIDMGQNLVGWVKLKVKGDAGTVVKMRFAERLDNDENLYVDNLRGATATDSYVLKGLGEESYTPYFTFHGFRYVEVIGYPGALSEDAITAEVISSVEKPTGYLETSSELVNKMYSLGIWGQRGNFISVPTDCPQRDERLGYTGDGQVFWRTGTYNFDIAAFTHKWMNDVRDEQTIDGGFPNTAPAVPKSNRKNGAPGWEDAGVIVPWSSWLQYGDNSIIQDNWTAMVRYMDYVESKSEGYIRPGGFLGDWLAPDPSTPNNLISTGLWGMTAKMMSEMAKNIGKESEVARYWELNKKIQAAFMDKFIAADGTVGSGSQTSYAIALYTGMVPDSIKGMVTEKLVKAIEEREWHVSTGFLGTPYLLFALSDNGRADVAYRLLLNETFPSWGFMIKNGATTWWEHWDSSTGNPKMNSFNHYAFGSVVEWIYRSMAGINTDPEAPGFKKIIIRPVFDRTGKITEAKGAYESVYGKIVSQWKLNSDDTVRLAVEIPANTTAKVIIPEYAAVNEINGVKVSDPVSREFQVGSGYFEYTISLKKK